MKNYWIVLIVMGMTTMACSQKSGGVTTKKVSKNGILTIDEYLTGKDYSEFAIATFAGGCFWCTEASFERIEGVKYVISGYAGGEKLQPTYEEVCSGTTGHTEAIQIYYDPEVVSFNTLLEVFFVAHDPTQLNRQGPDRGTQYRSAIFYHDDEQKQAVDVFMKAQAANFSQPIVTEVAPYGTYWVAEEYHQDYYESHPGNPYIANVSKPKVEKVKKVFADILKPKFKK